MSRRTKLEWHGDLAKQVGRDGRTRALTAGAEHVLQESRRIVPIEEGVLQASGVASVDGDRRAAVSYDTPYAARQHEELTWRHAPGRQAKYLEQPLVQERTVVGRVIERELRAAFRQAGG